MNGVWTLPILLKKAYRKSNNRVKLKKTIQKTVLSFSVDIGEFKLMKWITSFFIFSLTAILQFSGVILALVLEVLSGKKMGVARYLVFKKQDFETTYFTPAFMNIYFAIFAAGAVVSIGLLIFQRKKRIGILPLLFAVMASVIGIIFIQLNPPLQAYHFFLIGIFIVVVFQYFRILFASLFRKKVK